MAHLLILGEDQVRALVGPRDALDIARRTLIDQAHGAAVLSVPAAMTLDATALGGRRFKFKAAGVGHARASGIRLISRLSSTGPDANHYCMIYRHDTASPAGLVSELWLSRLRTAAFGVAVAEHLVNPGPLTVALFGAGAIAREIVPMLALALSVSELRVHSRRAESMSRFAAEHAAQCPFPVRAVPAARDAVRGADLLITVTESARPLVFADDLKPGAVVCSMGNYNELDYGVLQSAQRLVVDDADFAAEAGDGAAWIDQGHLTRASFAARIDALACEVAAGMIPGRRDPAQRVVALLQGMATGDVAFAAHALDEATRRGLGKTVELP